MFFSLFSLQCGFCSNLIRIICVLGCRSFTNDEKEQINDLSEREARIVEADLRLEQRRLSAGEIYRDEHPEFLRDYYSDEPEETKKLKLELKRKA